MRTALLALAGGLVLLGAATLVGCTAVISTEPPPDQVEIIGAPSHPDVIWIAGFWTHRHGAWVWVPGHWERRPHHDARWVPGHWDRGRHGWRWTPGRWHWEPDDED